MRSRAPWIFLIVLVAALAGGLFRLLQLRFERGNIYPPYSSLRADPLGCRVLFESLSEMPGLDVSRHLDELDQIAPQPPPALILAGTDTFGWHLRSRRNSAALRATLAGGGRVIVALEPHGASWFTNRVSRSEYDDDEDEEGAKDKENASTNKPASHSSTNSLASTNRLERFFTSWGFDVDVDYSKELDEHPSVAIRTTNAPAWLPREIPCHTHAYFVSNSAWRVCYTRENRPVAIERNISGGSMIILADAYVLSNEAMRNDRSPALLTWLIGDHARVIFDESHHGIAWQTGFGDLARKYGLVGFLIGLLLLAALYVWMSSVPLLPRETDENIAAETRVAGRDSAAGLINLLRRNIPEKAILAECLTAWESAKPESLAANRRTEIRKITATEPDPVAAYRAIARALSVRSFQRLEKPPTQTSSDWKTGLKT